MDLTTKYTVRKGDCVSREIAGETLIVPVRSQVGDLDSIYTLNEMGATIWRRLDGRTTIAEIVEAVCAEYEVTPEVAEKDTSEFLQSLEAAGLICPSDSLSPQP